jgi:hypothetical protein
MAHYDFTVMSDFLKTHGASITPLVGELRWLILIYLMFAIFIDAGLLAVATKRNTTPAPSPINEFWIGGATYFFSFLKIAGFFFLLAAVWTMVIFLPVGRFLEPSLEYFSNEKYSLYGLLFLLIVYLIGLSYLFLWSVASRFWKIETNATIATCLKIGWWAFNKNKGSTWRLLGLFFLLQLFLALIYQSIDSLWGMKSVSLLVFMAFAQQLFSFFRVIIRQIFYTAYIKILIDKGHSTDVSVVRNSVV